MQFTLLRTAIGVSVLALATGPFVIAGPLDCATPGSPCNDQITSLGRFVVDITNPAIQAIFAGSPPPGYDPSSHLFMSPLLFDPNTLIGRSTSFADGSADDTTNPIPVGTGPMAITTTGDPALKPSGFPTGNTEIHTAVLDMNLAAGGFQVLAGASMTAHHQNSPGEVESIGGAGFPASSFFDIFVDVEIPGLGTLYTDAPLLVQNPSIDALPPTVIYVHGASSPAPLKFNAGGPAWSAGDTLGTILLSGHGANYSPNGTGQNNDAGAFNQQFKQLADSSGDPRLATFVDAQLPEPSTTVLLFSALAALGSRAIRRKRS